MALEACPACNKAISIKARDCPNCGEPLEANWGREAARRRQDDRPTKFQSLLVAVVLGTLVPGSILIGISSLTSDEPSTPSSAQISIPRKELTPEEIQAKARQATLEREQAKKREMEALEKQKQQERRAFMERLRREMKSFETFNISKFTGTNFGFLAVNTVFQVWASICAGLELDPKYVDVIVRRWEAYTGGNAIHAESGLTFAEMRKLRNGKQLLLPPPAAAGEV